MASSTRSPPRRAVPYCSRTPRTPGSSSSRAPRGRGQYWETILGLTAAHTVGHCTNYGDSDVYRFYKDSRAWSADAGLVSDDQTLRVAYERAGGLGEEIPLLFVLFKGLGIPGCAGFPPYWRGETLTPDSSGLVIMPRFEITFG